MFYFKHILSSLILVTSGAQLLGSVTLDINQGGFENSDGVASAGMPYGALVDTSSDGFFEGNYLGFDLTLNGQFLETSSGVSDDWFVYGGDLGSGQTPPSTASAFGLGDGSIGKLSGVEETNITEGNEFALMWFPSGFASAGSAYGFARDSSSPTQMLIPGSGGISAQPISVSTKSVGFTAIPEPSAYATILGFLGLGYAVFCRRRRSSSQE